MRMDSVLRKTQNYRLWRAGAWGCKLRSWTLDEFKASRFRGLVAIRTLGAGGGSCIYNLWHDQAELRVGALVAAGTSSSNNITIDELAPAEFAILQGEYLNDVFLLDGYPTRGSLHYSTMSGAHMRDALRSSAEDAHGLRADLLLAQAMTPASREDWLALLAQYPGHVLEVSVYDRCLGDLPGRNALVWEVRKY